MPKPAIVRYIGVSYDMFTHGKEYEAYFLEYWEGKRNSLHVRGNDGRITDFNRLEDFVVMSDENDLLNLHEATVKCITDKYDWLELTCGREYKAIGRDKDGMYLVMDNTCCCYFYPPESFEVIEDDYDILGRESVYYSHNGGKNH